MIIKEKVKQSISKFLKKKKKKASFLGPQLIEVKGLSLYVCKCGHFWRMKTREEDLGCHEEAASVKIILVVGCCLMKR